VERDADALLGGLGERNLVKVLVSSIKLWKNTLGLFLGFVYPWHF